MKVRSGVNRTVLLTKRWAIKLPWGLGHAPVRGWLANRSEWRQRLRPHVCRPRATFGHVVLVMPRAEYTAADMLASGDDPLCLSMWISAVMRQVTDSDEAKASSWGWFGHRWLLIDFDRAWEDTDRGLVGALYYRRQERLARRWAKLSDRDISLRAAQAAGLAFASPVGGLMVSAVFFVAIEMPIARFLTLMGGAAVGALIVSRLYMRSFRRQMNELRRRWRDPFVW